MKKSWSRVALGFSWVVAALLSVFIVLSGRGTLGYPFYFLVLYLHDAAGGSRSGGLGLSGLAAATLVLSALLRVGQGPFLDFLAVVPEVGALVLFLFVFRRLQAKRDRIAVQASQLATLVEELPVGVSVLGEGGGLILSNAELSRLLRLPSESLRAAAYRSRTYVHADGTPMSPAEFATSRVLAGEDRVSHLVTGIDLEGGQRIWAEVSAASCQLGDWRVLTVTSDVTAAKEADDQIRRLLVEKEILLGEVHHRVKNNFSTVRALLLLQAENAEPALRQALHEAAARVLGMADAYTLLFQQPFHDGVPAGDFLRGLVGQVLPLLGKETLVHPEVTTDQTVLPPSQAPAVGIFVNELLTNSCKYAWTEQQSGRVCLSLEGREGRVVLCYWDDGPGLGEAYRDGGFGISLVRMLAQSLRGTLDREPGPGIQWRLSFPLDAGVGSG